jgi:hypothetical protein
MSLRGLEHIKNLMLTCAITLAITTYQHARGTPWELGEIYTISCTEATITLEIIL